MSALLSTSTKIDLKAVIRCPVLPRLAIVRLITSSDAVTKRKVTGPALKQHFRDRYSIFSPLDGDYGSCSLPDDIASEKGTCLYRSSFFPPHYVESVHLQPMNLLPLNQPPPLSATPFSYSQRMYRYTSKGSFCCWQTVTHTDKQTNRRTTD